MHNDQQNCFATKIQLRNWQQVKEEQSGALSTPGFHAPWLTESWKVLETEILLVMDNLLLMADVHVEAHHLPLSAGPKGLRTALLLFTVKNNFQLYLWAVIYI